MNRKIISQLYQRGYTHIRFRGIPIKRWYFKTVIGPIRAHQGWFSRQLEYPFSLFSPTRKKEISIARPSALGDVLLCTPSLREFKKRNPTTSICFYTNHPELVAGLPYIDKVGSYQERPWDTIEFRYEESLPPKRHIAKIFGDQLNIEVIDVRPDCIFPTKEIRELKDQYQNYPRPWIVIHRKAGPWTPNKDWSEESWNVLIPKLLTLGTVFELGTEKHSMEFTHPNYLSLIGQTTKSEMIALISLCNINIGPISGPVHIASAAQVPSVVIYGGYESVSCSGYSQNINLSVNLKCSPCWLTSPCPINKECLNQISPDLVLEQVKTILSIQGHLKKTNIEEPILSRSVYG